MKFGSQDIRMRQNMTKDQGFGEPVEKSRFSPTKEVELGNWVRHLKIKNLILIRSFSISDFHTKFSNH